MGQGMADSLLPVTAGIICFRFFMRRFGLRGLLRVLFSLGTSKPFGLGFGFLVHFAFALREGILMSGNSLLLFNLFD